MTRNEKAHHYYLEHRDEILKRTAPASIEWHKRNKGNPEYAERKRADNARYRVTNKDKRRENQKAYCIRHWDRVKESNRRYTLRIKAETFLQYGGCVCACCGESGIQFLTLDHIDSTSKSSRKQRDSISLWLQLRKENWPPGFQVLCFNCNCAKRDYDACPHQFSQLRLVEMVS